MEFNLKKDLCFFDIESTGLNVIRDRIVQIAILKYFANGREPAELTLLINPGIPISEEAMAVHGITPNPELASSWAHDLYQTRGKGKAGVGSLAKCPTERWRNRHRMAP